MTLFESKNDIDEAEKYVQIFGADEFWLNITVFLKNGLPEAFIKSLLKMPNDHKIISLVGSELTESDNLLIISDFILKSEIIAKEAHIVPLKLKILCRYSDDAELFMNLMKDNMVSYLDIELI